MISYSTLGGAEQSKPTSYYAMKAFKTALLAVGVVSWCYLFYLSADGDKLVGGTDYTHNNNIMDLEKKVDVATKLSLHKGSISIDGIEYPRYEIKGKGDRWKEISGQKVLEIPLGEDFNVVYQNKLDGEDSIIHAHGLTPPNALDGVPFLSTLPMKPNREAAYQYSLADHNQGTYFLHSHFGLQHEKGMSVPLIIRGDAPKGYPLKKEIDNAGDILMNVEDFCAHVSDLDDKDTNPGCFNPAEVYKYLADQWQADNPGEFDFDECMEPTTGSDVHYSSHLVNGRTLNDPIVQYVEPGKFYRVRIIDNGGMTNYELRFPVEAHLISTDGQWAQPYKSENFYIGVAQRVDVLIQIPEDAKSGDVLPIFAVAEMITDQAGIVLVVKHKEHEDDDAVTMRGRRVEMLESEPVTTIVDEDDSKKKKKFPFGPVSDLAGRREINMIQEKQLTAFFPLVEKKADVEFEVDLTGDNGFSGINKLSYQLPPVVDTFKYNENALEVHHGDRVCMTFKNYNADAHAMHLHSTSFQIMEINGEKINGAMRDTVLVPPGACQTVKVCFDATNSGEWPLHCHMSFHLSAGMLTTLRYVA